VSPIEPFKTARYAIAEVSLYRYGQTPPRAGDLEVRDGEVVRILRVEVREPKEHELRMWDFYPGDFVVSLEYELHENPR
jgi:hypothetical protein